MDVQEKFKKCNCKDIWKVLSTSHYTISAPTQNGARYKGVRIQVSVDQCGLQKSRSMWICVEFSTLHTAASVL